MKRVPGKAESATTVPLRPRDTLRGRSIFMGLTMLFIYREERIMKRFGRLIALTVLTITLLVPGLSRSVSAQDADLCDAALEAGVGGTVGRYAVVALSGGSGSQIVLGTDGDDQLRGGSGNDVLCGFTGYDILDGGSGNDLLVNGEGGGKLDGGSGNDTLIGYVGDLFDGGSGRNALEVREIEIPEPAQDLWLAYEENTNVLVTIYGSGFTPNNTVTVDPAYYDAAGTKVQYPDPSTSPTDTAGAFRFDHLNVCDPATGFYTAYLYITATDEEGITYTERFDRPTECPPL